MPKLEVNLDNLLSLIPQIKTVEELEELLPVAKAEFDGIDEEKRVINVELNDTNRPDLWSAAGLARLIRGYLTGKYKDYDKEWKQYANSPSEEKIITAKKETAKYRPFVAGFLADFEIKTEDMLIELIQTQEKIASVFGKKRERISMGLYNAELIKFPITYGMFEPNSVKFTPLQFETQLTLNEILEKHPTGIEYAHIINKWDKYPVLMDAENRALSLVPIINSNDLGRIEVGSKYLLIEATGTSFEHTNLAVNVFAADIEDMGGKIYPITVKYEHDLPPKKDVVLPYSFDYVHKASKTELTKLLGIELTTKEIKDLLTKMGYFPSVRGEKFTVRVPSYRRDIMHTVDLVEDIAIAFGYDNFQEVPLESYTVGQAKPIQAAIDAIRDLMIGLGYMEVFTYVLSNEDDCKRKMRYDEPIVKIKNVMSQSFSVLRNSMLPVLFKIESENTGTRYPHRIFEVGEIVRLRQNKPETIISLGIINIGQSVNLSSTMSDIWALLSTTGVKYELKEANDPRFMEGRCANVVVNGQIVGTVGEFHPEVLTNWGLTLPAAGGEILITDLVNAAKQ